MDGMLQPPTVFDTWTSVASAALYLLVGLGALARAPKDARARTFFAIAIASLAPFLLPAVMGRLGSGTLLTIAAVATAVSLAVGSVALFHFTQVFPGRRPWIRGHGLWLALAYAVLPVGAAIGAWALLPVFDLAADMQSQMAGSGGLGGVVDGAATIGNALVLLIVLIPTVVVVGIVVPFAALLSLYRSWQEAKRDRRDGARVMTLTILISQLGGGVLTILVVPLLHLVAPTGPVVMIAAVTLFGFGLLFPIAFAAAVWKYRLILQPD
jgi:hypothetical protein